MPASFGPASFGPASRRAFLKAGLAVAPCFAARGALADQVSALEGATLLVAGPAGAGGCSWRGSGRRAPAHGGPLRRRLRRRLLDDQRDTGDQDGHDGRVRAGPEVRVQERAENADQGQSP